MVSLQNIAFLTGILFFVASLFYCIYYIYVTFFRAKKKGSPWPTSRFGFMLSISVMLHLLFFAAMLRSSDDDLVILPQEKFGLDGESAFNIEFVAETGKPEQAAAPIEEPNEEPSTKDEEIIKTKTTTESVPTVATNETTKATPTNTTPTNTNPESTATNTSGTSATPGVPGGQSNGDEKALQIAEDMPIFPGCESELTPLEREICSKRKMTEFVQKNVKYPDIAMKNNTQGKITVSFIVEKNGDVTNIKVVGKPLGDGCEDAAIKSVQRMNSFTHKIIGGRQNGRPVRIKYNIPVTFTLQQRATN